MAVAEQANACVSTSTTPLDPHERLGPARATPGVGHFLKRRPGTPVWWEGPDGATRSRGCASRPTIYAGRSGRWALAACATSSRRASSARPRGASGLGQAAGRARSAVEYQNRGGQPAETPRTHHFGTKNLIHIHPGANMAGLGGVFSNH